MTSSCVHRLLSSSEDDWSTFIKCLASSVQQITGQTIDVAARDQGHGTSVKEELEASLLCESGET
jgi:hypothetical protein